MKTGKCFICGREGPVAEHHVWLQSAGGERGPVVQLDATCHHKLHSQALNAESQAEKVMLFNPEEWVRAKKLVEYAILSLRKNKYSPDFNDPYQLQVKMTKKDVFMLHLAKDEAGYTNLQSFVRDMLRVYIKNKYPQG